MVLGEVGAECRNIADGLDIATMLARTCEDEDELEGTTMNATVGRPSTTHAVSTS